jgi:probable rRNA maturation factor
MTSPGRQSGVLISSSQRAVRVERERLARLVRFVARAEGTRVGQIDLAVVGRDEIAGLNRRWLNHRGPTDVLSFDLHEGDPLAEGGSQRRGGPRRRAGLSGQLVVCGDVAREQALLRGLPVQQELMLYVVHGMLHLMSYEDLTIRGAARMHAREEEILREFLRCSTPRRGSKSEIRNSKSETNLKRK